MAVTLPSVYQDGTATVAASGAVVTGQSTLWTKAVLPGDFFGVHKGYAIRILSVDSDTQLTLANAWPGAAQTAAHYEIMLQSDIARMQETSRQLLQQLSNGNIAAFAGLTGAADTLGYFTGSGTMALTSLTSFGRSLIDDANASTALSTLGVSTYIKTLLDDVDASAALSTLGVSAYAKTLLDDADAAAARTTIGAFPSASVSAFMATVLDDADAATARATLNTAWEPIGNEISLGGLSSAAFVLPSQYKAFKLLLYQITPTASILTTARTSIDGGASYAVGASDYSYLIVSTIAAAAQPATGSAAAANLVFTGTLQGNNGRVAGEITIDPGSGSQFPTFIGKTCGVSSGADLRMFDFVTRREATQRINAFALFCSSGTWVVGFARLMGMRS
ncbi:hypothetical protein [Rhizobium rhizogenes]|uniref:hypothetical protein n=1 Tax=Rhizobium rhizogenes TaxID=359 RepID=UPI0024BE1E2E|nr:hypothetical protein [Rhizobium rhizogenes]MDJ1632238.1 hypothetical protein [Rhizobium rhizogenes]